MFELIDNIEFKIYKVSLRFYERGHRQYPNLPFLSQVLEHLNDGAGRKQKSKYRTDSVQQCSKSLIYHSKLRRFNLLKFLLAMSIDNMIQ